MRKALFTMMCLAAMLAAGTGLKAQEITIGLYPGWNWISYPNAEAMDIAAALGEFAPMQGDILTSQYGFTTYTNGRWRGSVTQFIPGWGYMYYSSRTDYVEFVFAQAASSVVVTATPTDITATSAVVGGMVTLPEGSHVFLRGVCWGMAPSPDIDGDHTTESTGQGVFIRMLDSLTPNTTYYVRAYVVWDSGLEYGNEMSFTTLEGGSGGDPGYVDLGLPSGLLWATCNVGANAPEEYGDYFAWGETQPKSIYNWTTYQYSNGNNYMSLTKYCNDPYYGYNGFTDTLTILLPEDDAATTNWGSDWRTPTIEDWFELYQNTTQTWATQNGVNGMLFTASNGNSFFLPAAGDCYDSTINSMGDHGYYWSSSLYTYPCDANHIMIFETAFGMSAAFRNHGHPVRAVRSSGQNNALTGAVNGKFTINDNVDQVYFSQGNLQYIGSASTPYWKFADNQWDVLGTTTGQNSSDQNVDRDLFGWGTSGYNHGANCYQPWSTSTSNSDYYAYGSYTYNLYDQTGQADWGYNPISNGGNQANQWCTLTRPEWAYVFNTRTTSSGIRYAKANVNNVNGVILLPDDWSASYYMLNNTNTYDASFSSNVITASQWNTLEQHGAVFLPAAGHRDGTSVYFVGSSGFYWSASCSDSGYAYGVYFVDSYLNPQSNGNRFSGQSVRLVRSAQ